MTRLLLNVKRWPNPKRCWLIRTRLKNLKLECSLNLLENKIPWSWLNKRLHRQLKVQPHYPKELMSNNIKSKQMVSRLLAAPNIKSHNKSYSHRLRRQSVPVVPWVASSQRHKWCNSSSAMLKKLCQVVRRVLSWLRPQKTKWKRIWTRSPNLHKAIGGDRKDSPPSKSQLRNKRRNFLIALERMKKMKIAVATTSHPENHSLRKAAYLAKITRRI